MPFFEWNSDLDVRVNEMNDQHKVLISIMNELHDRNAAGASPAEIEKLMAKLGDYTEKHFKEEEALMEKMGFSGLAAHRIIHEDLLGKFTDHYYRFKNTKKLSDEFFDFLSLWLRAHIQAIDTKYGSHIAHEKD